MCKKIDTDAENLRLGIAIFEGRDVTLEEAKKSLMKTRRRDRVLKESFGLSENDLDIICGRLTEISQVLTKYCELEREIHAQSTRERMQQIEAKALARMRGQGRKRIFGLMSPR